MTVTRSAIRPPWMEEPTAVGKVTKATALAVVCVLLLLPFAGVLSTSLSSQQALAETGSYVLIPRDPTFAAYQEIWAGGAVSRALLVSAGVTVIGTALATAVTVLLAYGLSRRGSFGHRAILTVVLLTFLFHPGIIPQYLTVRSLGLLDSYAALILPSALSAFNVIIMRGFFMGLPAELYDSARIDGAGELRILAQIVLPLSKAVIAVIGLFYAVGFWNAWFNALLYLNDSHRWPLQLLLRTYVLQGQSLGDSAAASADVPPPQQAVQAAVVMVALVPILLVYPFLQRHFTKGVLTGAVKG
ncbi:carbohydrate ABC transporter permease [Kribbella sp. NPDC050124]|uniref:carbohydrate ABC transporter permease n=1 Tax=Kribbella sp. NPDC050124 TaxID=3364114 RepID=UPI0037AAE1E1